MASGNYAEAAKSYATFRELVGDQQSAALIQQSFNNGGWPAVLRAITARAQLARLSPYEAVVFLAAAGEKEGALAELERSYEVFGPLLRIEPLLDPLRGDPRFAEILARAGLSR